MTHRYEILNDIVEAIAESEDCAPHDLDYSLYEHIETEALLTLAASEYTNWQLTFRVPDHTVEIRGTGQILVDDTVHRKLELPAR
ncbi:MAG: HalOD1 output domain-containing protein [Haloarculaceae archaeon]